MAYKCLKSFKLEQGESQRSSFVKYLDPERFPVPESLTVFRLLFFREKLVSLSPGERCPKEGIHVLTRVGGAYKTVLSLGYFLDGCQTAGTTLLRRTLLCRLLITLGVRCLGTLGSDGSLTNEALDVQSEVFVSGRCGELGIPPANRVTLCQRWVSWQECGSASPTYLIVGLFHSLGL